MEIRRAASLVGTGDGGYVLGILQQKDSSGNEQALAVFEKSSDGTVSLQPVANIRFTDGSPATIATLP